MTETTTLRPVRYSASNGVARITLAAPERGNPLNATTLAAIVAGLEQAEADTTMRAVALDAEGEQFSSGLDLSPTALDAVDTSVDSLWLFANTLLHMRRSPLPILACIEGRVTGGGVGLVAACDIVLAAPGASFILPEVILGMVPAVIAPVLLNRVAPGRLGALALSSRTLSAIEAKEIGIVDEIAEESLRATLTQQLLRIGRSSPDAISASKRIISDFDRNDLKRRLEEACLLQAERLQRPDVREGVRFFAEGFSPPWFRRIGEP